MVYVTLVDGVGRPKLLPLPDAEDLPAFIGYAHEGVKSGPHRLVKFIRCPDLDLDGRPIYRLRGSGTPSIRYEFLRLQAIGGEPFNGPRAT